MSRMAHPNHPIMTPLPTQIPLFPLRGFILLPGAELPLNVFEPRMVALLQDALAHDRVIGIIQPQDKETDLYSVGCAGRITQFTELENDRYLITLSGLSRFEIESTHITTDHYYKADVKWIDTNIIEPWPTHYTPSHCRQKFKTLLDHYLAREHIAIDWDEAMQVSESRFYTIVTMLVPLSPQEKQALLEAKNFETRCDMLYRLLDRNVTNHDYKDDNIRSIH
jgi:Lon protease-like protein